MIAIASKKTPRRSDRIEPALIGILLVILLSAVAYSIVRFKNQAVAIVNGEDITKEDLEFWYKLSVVDEQVSQYRFLKEVLVPQYILMQQAQKDRIMVSEEEVNALLGSYLRSEQMTLDEFSSMLSGKGITLDQVREGFKSKAIIYKLLSSKNYAISIKNGNPVVEDALAQAYINDLVESAQFQILLSEDIEFTKLPGGCDNTLRLFVSSSCVSCKDSSNIFKRVVSGQRIPSKLWVLDTGDDLMTKQKEEGIPADELEFFRYAQNKVPALMVGCSYQYLGPIKKEHVKKAIEVR